MKLFSRSSVVNLIAVGSVLLGAQAQAQTLGFQPTVTGSPTPRAPINVFYIDPVNGSMNGDGSLARPWSTLQAVVAANLINGANKTTGAVHAGDLIYLLSGNHGSVTLSGANVQNTDFITIQAAPQLTPVLNQLTVTNGSNWVFSGLSLTTPSTIPQHYHLAFLSGCSNIIFTRNKLSSASTVRGWTPQDWMTSVAYRGVYCSGNNITISYNTLYFVRFGITTEGDNVVVNGNLIDCFADDGIDFTSTNTVITRNSIINHYGHLNDGNHNDFIQGWPAGSEPLHNILIDRNTVLYSTNEYPYIIPSFSSGIEGEIIQGISIFDGTTTNLTATNNVIVDSAYHGLAFYGLSNSVIANNTLYNSATQYESWVGVFPQGSINPSNVIVRNNLSPNFNLAKVGVTDDHNIAFIPGSAWSHVASETLVTDPTTIFVKFVPSTASFDFNLKTGSPAIGTGNSQYAPTIDILGRTRNPSKMDIGAYSYVGP